MKLEKKILPWSVIELILEEEDITKLAKYKTKAIESLSKSTKIKWFRPWATIPDTVIIKQYGDEYISSLAIEYAIDFMYQEALKKEKLLPVSQAEVMEVISQNPIKIKIHIEVFPTIEIDTKYKKIKLKKQKVEVGNEEVENALLDIQTRFTKFEIQEGTYKIQQGDRVSIDTEGFDDKNIALEWTNMQEYPIVIGSKMLVPGFEEGLIGKSEGEELSLDITFPADYHSPDFAGKKTLFRVSIKKVEKSVIPEFTPEFIKNLRGKDLDLEGFRVLIQEEIKETKEMNVRLDEEHKLIDELDKVTKMEIGTHLLENQIKNVFAEIKENLGKDNMRMQDYLESLRMTEEDYKEKTVKPIAEKRLKGELILHKLRELEKVEVSEEEIKQEIAQVMKRFESEEVRKRLEELYVPGTKYYEELNQRIGYRKLIDSFFEE
jgi:trigger factor